jgi:3-dehydroquinate dehydratase II
MKMAKVLIIHGPNLNLLGIRETDIYGKLTLSDINGKMEEIASKKGVTLEIVQSNHEGEIVDTIQKSRKKIDALIINPAAYTHTSIAIRDAILTLDVPVIEIHLSNIYGREEFRSKSLISDIATGQISGFGPNSYIMGLNAAIEMISNKKKGK